MTVADSTFARWPRAGRLTPQALLSPLAAALAAYLTLVPLGFLLYGSFLTPIIRGEGGTATVQHYLKVYTDPTSLPLLGNSLAFAAGTAVVAFTIGALLAWVTERTNTPLRGLFSSLSLVPLIIPGILFSLSWIFLLSPRIGLLNLVLRRALGLEGGPFNIFSLGGMIWVEGLHWSPLAYLMMAASFRSMDPALEESAIIAGVRPLLVFWRITLRLGLPTIISVFLVLFLRGIETFEVPAIIGLPAGIPVFTSRIYLAVKGYPSDLGLAGAYSTILLLLSLGSIALYARATRQVASYTTITSRGFRPRPLDLGRWRYPVAALMVGYLVLIVVLPVLVLLWNSLLPFYRPPSSQAVALLTLQNYAAVLTLPHIRRAMTNSLLLSLGSATIVMALTAVIAWIVVRTRWRGRGLLDQMASLPLVFPGIVLGVALARTYLTLPVPIYGTLWILLIAYITRYLPYGVRASSAGLLQIHRELEEAAEVSGASWWRRFVRVVVPLLGPGLLAGWIYVVIVSARELSSSILLWGPGSEVLSVVIFELWQSGHAQELAALGSLLIAMLVLVIAAGRRFLRLPGLQY